jgi:lipoate-protein ligase A
VPLIRSVPLLVESGLAARESLARDRFLLEAVHTAPDRWPGALRVYELSGDVLALGRWHLAPDAAAGAPTVIRRHSGGRVVPLGAGLIGVSLVLPHRAALFAPDADALRPEQVMNRYVRGVLGALDRIGVRGVYPGRDTLTADRRLLGVVSFAETPAGALLVEVVLAVRRDFSILPGMLDRADPGGVVRAEMLGPGDVTSLEAQSGRGPNVDELAGLIARGYAERLGLHSVARRLETDELAEIARLAASELGDPRWLLARRPRPDLDRRALTATVLGSLEVHLAVDDGGIRDVLIAGDLLAGGDTVPALETALRGCPAARTRIEAAVHEVLAGRGRWVLGVGEPATIVDTIVKAAGA